jgi:hypothetical protein
MSMIGTMNWLKDPEAKVVEKITLAFLITPPPKDENIVGAGIGHLQKCDECRNAQHFFEGKTREIILGDERNYPHLVNAFDFFTPETWHYYLPVFLIQYLIRQRHSFNHFWHHNEPGLIEAYWLPRIQLMDGPQCEALIGYLEFHKSYAIESGDIEKLEKILDRWQAISQEKVAIVRRPV